MLIPTEIILKIIENVSIKDIISLCNSSKRYNSICSSNQHILCNNISKIKILRSYPSKYYKCVKGLNYMKIIKFINSNNLIRESCILSPESVLLESNNISLDVLKFLLANDLSLTQTVVNNTLSRFSLEALKFLIENKKIKLNGYRFFDLTFNKVKYLSSKGFLPDKEEIKFIESKEISNFLKEKFKIREQRKKKNLE